MIGWCGRHKRSMWWRSYPMGWYCPDCMRAYRVTTTNTSMPKSE